jgi:C3HC zinc finger-like
METLESKSNHSKTQKDLAARVRTFTVLKWCGMPYSINPLKIARLGFECTDINKITCQECKVSINLK